MISLRGSVVRVYLPPDANSLLSVAEHCLRSRNYVNLIVTDKQPHLQYLDLDEAREHAAAGASVWDVGEHSAGRASPMSILASIGDVPTLEALAAAALLRERVPELAAALRQRRRPDATRRRRRPPARAARATTSSNCSDATTTSSSRSTATPGRSTSSFTAAAIRPVPRPRLS